MSSLYVQSFDGWTAGPLDVARSRTTYDTMSRGNDTSRAAAGAVSLVFMPDPYMSGTVYSSSAWIGN